MAQVHRPLLTMTESDRPIVKVVYNLTAPFSMILKDL